MKESELVEYTEINEFSPSPGDRAQLRLADPEDVLVLVRIDGVDGDSFNGEILGFYDWQSKAQYTAYAGPTDIQMLAASETSKNITFNKKYIHKVVYANVEHKARWASGIAMSFVKQFYPNARAITLEEIEFNIESGNWDITVGIIRESVSDKIGATILDNVYKDRERREYKKISVDPVVGDAIKMTIREIGV